MDTLDDTLLNGHPTERLPGNLNLSFAHVEGEALMMSMRNAKLDEQYEFHGVPVVIDKRSLMYLDGVVVDFHDDLNRRGFSISNPQAKSTCGCGSSFSM